MASFTIPSTMKALQLNQFFTKSLNEYAAEGNLEEVVSSHVSVDEIAVPKPKNGQVLVKVARSPINPSDLSSLKGTYNPSGRAKLPASPGFEGSGVVVASGGGVLGWSLLGKRVAVAAQDGGLWAEYVVIPATQCIAIPDDISFDTAASLFVNPWTVLGFLEIAHAGGHKTIVHTAAASALGKMLISQGKEEGIQVIGIVRRDEQIDELKSLGACEVYSTTSDDWKTAFKQKCAELKCTLAFDAVAGPLTGEILHAMPKGSVVKVYGGLAEDLCRVSPGDLIFQRKRLEGFWLSDYIKTKSMVGLFLWQRKVKSLLNSTLNTHVRGVYTLEQFPQAVDSYLKNMSAGKVLLAPGFLDESTSAPASSSASPSSSSSSSTLDASSSSTTAKDKEKDTDEQEDAFASASISDKDSTTGQ
jgi:NADPH2:quinone reductase